MAIARQRIDLPRGAWRRAFAAWRAGTLWDGDDVARLEREFAAALGAPAAVAAPSGRAGLRFLFDALQLEPGCEVICSGFAYPVVPFLAKSLGFKLRFADCELRSLAMDPAALERIISDRTGAVIVTHLYGVPGKIREIAEICARHGVRLIEDCAHCFSAAAGGKRAGTFGQGAYFSFETSKLINTMGGGMILLDDTGVAERVRKVAAAEPPKDLAWLRQRLLRTTFEAAVTHPLVFNAAVYPALRLAAARRKSEADDRFASGYHGDAVTLDGRMGRFTNYQAGLALDQLGEAEARSARRRANALRLIERLRGTLHLQEPGDADTIGDYMLVTALLPNRQQVADALLRQGVDTKYHYMRDCSRLAEAVDECPNSARAEDQVLHLPAHPDLSEAAIDRVAETVLRVVASL